MDKKVTTSIVLPEKLWKQMKLQAFRDEISLGELIRKSMETTLSGLKAEKGKKRPRKTATGKTLRVRP
jgi:predicted DNA-binding ribbon-helix-helix protein